MERILGGVDGSGPSLKAVDFAADLASKYNAELIVLTVAPHSRQSSTLRSRNTRDWSISQAPRPSSF
jgi:nucleotide-binding universal stress UspA family protein